MKGSQDRGEVLPWLAEGSDASPELRELLRLGGALPEDGARIDRLRTRLEPWLVAPGAPPGSPGAGPRPGGSAAAATGVSAGTKILLVALGVGFASAASLNAVGPGPVPRAATRATVSAAPAAAPTAGPPLVTEPTTSNDAAREPPAPALRAESKDGKSERTPTKPSSPPSLGAEARELEAARRLLAAAPARALEQLRHHAEQHPTSVLAEERRLFTIEALTRLGRSAEAHAELAALRRSSPRSVHLHRAEKLLQSATP